MALPALSLTAGVADAKTLTLQISPDKRRGGLVWSPRANPGCAQVWGPGGHCRTCNWVHVGYAQYRRLLHHG